MRKRNQASCERAFAAAETRRRNRVSLRNSVSQFRHDLRGLVAFDTMQWLSGYPNKPPEQTAWVALRAAYPTLTPVARNKKPSFSKKLGFFCFRLYPGRISKEPAPPVSRYQRMHQNGASLSSTHRSKVMFARETEFLEETRFLLLPPLPR